MTTYTFDAVTWTISTLTQQITGSSHSTVTVVAQDNQSGFSYDELSSSALSSVVRLDQEGIYSVFVDDSRWAPSTFNSAEIVQFNWSGGLSGSSTVLGLNLRVGLDTLSYLVSLNGPNAPLIGSSSQLLNFVSGPGSIGNATAAPAGYREGDNILFADIPAVEISQDDYIGDFANTFGEVDTGLGNDTIVYDDSHALVNGGDGVDNLTSGNSLFFFEVNIVDDEIQIQTEIGLTTVRNIEIYDFGGQVYSERAFLEASAPEGQNLTGTAAAETLTGTRAADRLEAGAGDDTLLAGDGADTVIGNDGNDVITAGASRFDLRDLVYGGAGDDNIDGGYGNDELRGDDGADTLTGGFGADTVIGGSGDDILTGQAFGDEMFGGAGSDFINGGFGADRVNGGAGADRFYHLGITDHGSDWIQDFGAEDVLVFGGNARAEQFQINIAETANAGAAGVSEAFIIYRPTGQILWALVDGDSHDSITLRIAGQDFDLSV